MMGKREHCPGRVGPHGLTNRVFNILRGITRKLKLPVYKKVNPVPRKVIVLK
jgi:hypothetical protein